MSNLSKAERIRRAAVFERGTKEEFWLLLKEELESSIKYHEHLSLEHSRKEDYKQATREAVYAEVMREILNSPKKILHYHHNVFMRFGSWVQDKVSK